jgi:hypothetical protein
VAVAVDAGGQQHNRVDHASALADLHRQRVGGDERERPGRIQWPMPEVVNNLVEVGRHPRDMRLRERVDAEGLEQLVHPAGRDPGQVAVRRR